MKICILGNSHVGMLAGAVRKPEFRHLFAQFFACPGFARDLFEISGSALRSCNEKFSKQLKRIHMPAEVDISEFDALVLVAKTASVYSAMVPLRTHFVSRWPSTMKALGQHVGKEPLIKPVMSQSAYIASLVARIHSSVSRPLAEELRQLSSAPIYIIPQPCPSVKVVTIRKDNLDFSRIVEAGDGSFLTECLNAAHHRAFADISNVHYIPQPANTLQYGYLTALEYSRRALRYDGVSQRSENDTLHANADLGHRFFDEITANYLRT